MSNHIADWLVDLGGPSDGPTVDGLVQVDGYRNDGRPPEEVAAMEKAKAFGAHAVFFEAGRNGRPPIAQAFVFVSDDPADDVQFAELHRRLWSWGGVPLLYRRTPGLLQLFRCAHKPDFVSSSGETICKPFKTLKVAVAVNNDPWWDAQRLRNGTLWDDPSVCRIMLSSNLSAHKHLINAVKKLSTDLDATGILKKQLRRKLLILSFLIAYLEERSVLLPDYFGQFLPGAKRFFEILANGGALVGLLGALEDRFNGNVFTLEDADRRSLKESDQLGRFSQLVEARQELNGQLTLWELYSFKDLPVELISHIYQMFVADTQTSIYTPPFLVRLMLDEALSWARLDRMQWNNEIVLDPACGSGVFLVEAYKRMVLHWRSRNEWKQPSVDVLKGLLKRVQGIDLDEGAIELAAFSLCLALCDALEPETIRASIRLFPQLAKETLHRSCFFDAKERGLIKASIGLVAGNPPFTSSLTTTGALRSYERYEAEYGALPDKQLAFLFLHEAMEMVADGGALSMLQQYNFLYNKHSLTFRRNFFSKWDVREILDFISVRGLFQKGGADTKVIVVLAEASAPPAERKILHATFRRSGRVDTEQGFDIDYYDLHWLPRGLIFNNDGVWRTNLLGGGRVLALADRLKEFRTLGQYAKDQGWDFGEGFIEGQNAVSRPANHIIGKKLLPSEALTLDGIDTAAITEVPNKPIEGPRSEKRFSPPILLVREQMDLPHAVWSEGYLTYKNQIVGFTIPQEPNARLQIHTARLHDVDRWLTIEAQALRAFVACASVRLFTQKATTLSGIDILALPYPEIGSLDLSPNERILVDDIVDYYRELVRLGEDSTVMKEYGHEALNDFSIIFTQQINAIYKSNQMRILESQAWPGVICQPFAFGNSKVDWSGVDELREKLNKLLHEQQGMTLNITRIVRIYDGNFVFLLKPDRLRYWLRSIALRDADETLSDLREQGF